MSKLQGALRRPWVWSVMLLTLVLALVSATAVVSYNRGWGNHRAAMLTDLPQHDANLIERTRRSLAGLLEIDRLPEGVDRALAAKAEAEKQGFAYLDVPDCSIVLRLPTGRVVTIFPGIDAVGGQVAFGRDGGGCTRRGLPPRTASRPPVSERPARWDAAIRTGSAYVYAVPVNGSGAPGEFTFHATPPTAPMAHPSSVRYCFGIVPGE